MLPKLELWFAVILSAAAISLQVLFCVQSGPLWRDEVSTINLATSPTYGQMLDRLKLDSAPALSPTLQRLWSLAPFSDPDISLRLYGLFLSLITLVAVWSMGRLWNIEFPLLTLAAFSIHPSTLDVLGSIKPYGLGVLMVILLGGTIGWALVSSKRSACFLAAIVAILAVQTLYQNAVFVLAVCLAAAGVALWQRDHPKALALLGCGMLAALSLVPYLGILQASSDWRPLNETPSPQIFSSLYKDLFFSSGFLVATWLALLVAAIRSGWKIFSTFGTGISGRQKNLVLYAAGSMVGSTLLYLIFLKISKRPVQAWHWVSLMGLNAICLEIIIVQIKTARWARIVIALLVAVIVLPFSFGRAMTRQSNIDLMGAYLEKTAGPGDLIVLNPWWGGITFQRYYHGRTAWATIPPLRDLTVHRYDLVKKQMQLPDALAPLHQQMADVLKTGHRVWIVNGILFQPMARPPMPPAPQAPSGWRDGPYLLYWSAQTASFLESHTRSGRQIGWNLAQDVNPWENFQLLQFEGWK